MRKIILGVAVAGIAVAIAVRSDLKDDKTPAAAPVVPAAPHVEPQPAPVVEPHTTPVKPVGTVAPPESPAPAPTPAAPAAKQTATGAAVLQRASSAYSAIKTLEASFTLKRENPLLSSSTTSRGTLHQKRPDRFLMKFSQPAGDIIVSDGRYFWLYYPSADRRQVLRAPASQNGAGGVDLQAQFLGDPLRRFTHTYHGKESVGGRSAHVLTLVPREALGYKSLKVWVDEKDALVRRFILTEDNGVVQEFTLSNLAINPTLSNELFRFTPPADAQIVER